MLPSTHQEFSSKDYWDKFFIERKSKGFEWYGDWKDIRHYLISHLNINKSKGVVVNSNKPSESIPSASATSSDASANSSAASYESLVIGCGNSSLSQDLYDDASLLPLTSTNALSVISIDFSPVVIAEMEKSLEKLNKKNKNNNGTLKYLLMDMLHMDESWKGKYDMVIDKGAIDALMTDDTPQVIEQGTQMIKEIRRVLKPNGIYLCVSLLQKHIQSHLINMFIKSGDGWKVDIHPFIPSAGSSLCPFVIVAKCDNGNESSIKVHPFTFDQKATEKSLSSQTVSAMKDQSEIEKSIAEAQQSFLIQYSLKEYGKGFRGNFDIWDKNDHHSTSAKFKITVLDSGLNYQKQVKVPMAVFIVPKGREKEWMFSSEQSRMEIATDNGIGRLVVVELGPSKARSVQKVDMKAIQDELSKSVLQLAPKSLPQGFNIPFMTVEGSGDDDVKERNIIQQGTSQMSGDYTVEDVYLQSTSKWHRRLIFQSNASAVQSECVLIDEPSTAAKNGEQKSSASSSTAGSKKQQQQKAAQSKGSGKDVKSNELQKKVQTDTKAPTKSTTETTQKLSSDSVVRKKVNVILDSDDEDENEEEENINANATDSLAHSSAAATETTPIRKVDANKLVFEFHKVMIAGLCLSSFKRPVVNHDTPKRYMVIGLGGGALAMHLLKKKTLGTSTVENSIVDAIELDPEVIEIAHQFFGLEKQNPRMNIHAGDGLEFLKSSKDQYDAILLDVDAKDPSSPVISPPLEFLDKSLLENIRDNILKKDSGIIVFNLACRSQETQKAMLNSIKAVFSTVYLVHMGDSGLLNGVVFCLNTPEVLFQRTDRKIKNDAIKICKDSLIDMEDKINLDDMFGNDKGKKQKGSSQSGPNKKKGKSTLGDIPIISAEAEKVIAIFDSLQLL